MLNRVDTLPLADVLREHIRGDRLARLTVSSDSMAPLLKSGDVIGLRRAGQAQIEPGQIVTFSAPGDSQSLMTHRIAASWRDDQGHQLILTRGDHSPTFDPPWNLEAIIGQVIWRSRNGRILQFDQGPGQWLSKQLAAISEKERVRRSGLPVDALVLTADGIADANRRMLLARMSFSSRVVSLASRSGGQFLAWFAQIFARQEDFTAA